MSLKNMLEILPILESSSNTIVYALDETGVSVESDNNSSWSPVGRPPVLEKNVRHEGVNIIGSTAILNRYHIVTDTYPSSTSIKSKQVKDHIQYLLDLNEGKKVVIFLDNAKFHKSLEMKKFYYNNKEDLELIFLPKYSPFMNPQEQVWHYLKANLYKPSARGSKHELFYDINLILGELNLNKDRIRSLADGRKYLL
ncbi:hypothetical protein GKZ28_04935 [Clostridium chromiireducens]|uniref:Tc1-like transposase DDE domain-containing protein n=1 Tax=Clostridium chromiireducens TaxID=225345 RepID=A0A964RJU5_9CLOT|nr:transposase [Clostridium chromiireducens]MVX63042.1 hypothetical protein [Clostridium chromiireducens]